MISQVTEAALRALSPVPHLLLPDQKKPFNIIKSTALIFSWSWFIKWPSNPIFEVLPLSREIFPVAKVVSAPQITAWSGANTLAKVSVHSLLHRPAEVAQSQTAL